MIKIYGSMQGSAGRCLWLLEEIGVAYEQISLNMKEKEHKSEWYLKLNPNGKVPTLVDNDFVLFESYAINSYLVEKYKPELYGKTIEEKALINQWSLWGLNHIQRYFESTLYFLLFKIGSEESSEKAKLEVQPFLKVLNDYLVGKEFLVSNFFTLADLNMATNINVGVGFGYDFANYPEIIRWLDGVKARPALVKLLSTKSTSSK
jgi:glutathione S-transferase